MSEPRGRRRIVPVVAGNARRHDQAVRDECRRVAAAHERGEAERPHSARQGARQPACP